MIGDRQGLHDPGRRRARSRPSCSTTTARSCARSAASSAPPPAARAAAAGTTPSIARYAARVNGLTDFFLTKLDVLGGLGADPGVRRPTTSTAYAHRRDADDADRVPPRQAGLRVPRRLEEDISGCRTFDDLPKNAQAYVRALEEMSGAPIWAIGVGPDRDQTVVLR